jgi:hypothetical protein
VSWDDAHKAEESLVPDRLEWGPMPTPAVPMPGMET